MASKYEMDMCSGPLFSKIVKYAVPMMLTSILQLLYNAVDIIVVGRYVGSTALAAVGSTSSLINLIVNAFVGLSVGASVILAQQIGAGKRTEAFKTVHTAMTTAIIVGIFLGFFGFFACRPLLELMGSPKDVIDQSTLYMKIYFLGMPAFIVYTFGSAVMRTVGDTKRPLVFLSISGLANVALNLVFVLVFHMGVEGVAIATIASQYISALFVVFALLKSDGICRLLLKELKICWKTLFSMIKVGVPVAVQSCVFSLSNVLIQSSVNSFGSTAIAGNAAAANIEGFLYVAMNAFGQSATTFAGQNYGAKQYKRITKTLLYCVSISFLIGAVAGPLMYIFGEPLLKIYSPENIDAISFGLTRLRYIAFFYGVCGLMDSLSGTIRGTGSTFMPMLISILGVCGIRIVWVLTVFPMIHTLECLYVSYLLSWSFTAVLHAICYFVVVKRKFKSEN